MTILPPSYDYVLENPIEDATRTATQQCQFKARYSLEEKLLPDIHDAIYHLKLLKAFEVLKSHICHGLIEESAIEFEWKAFVTNSVRRFIIFVSALRHSFPEIEPSTEEIDSLRGLCKRGISPIYMMQKLQTEIQLNMDEEFSKTMRTLLPPLDILMVWHAFLLNPESFYDNFARNNFLKFIFYPFPLGLIQKAISDENFSYNPTVSQQESYTNIIQKFGYVLTYNFNEPFIPENLKVPLKCPNCETILGNVTLSDINRNNGFADSEFLYLVDSEKNCKCGFPKEITHDELRKRKLYADLSRKVKTLTSTKFGPHIIGIATEQNTLIKLFNFLKENKNESLSKITAKFCTTRRGTNYFNMILKESFAINLIYLTIKKRNIIKISEDLIGSILVQKSLTEKTKQINWLMLPTLDFLLQEAFKRYRRFWDLILKSNNSLVPALDIDLFLSTHQLNFKSYMIYCLSKKNLFVYYDNTTEQAALNDKFERTATLYSKNFDESYKYIQANYNARLTIYIRVLI